jgi:hypothetical protein
MRLVIKASCVCEVLPDDRTVQLSRSFLFSPWLTTVTLVRVYRLSQAERQASRTEQARLYVDSHPNEYFLMTATRTTLSHWHDDPLAAFASHVADAAQLTQFIPLPPLNDDADLDGSFYTALAWLLLHEIGHVAKGHRGGAQPPDLTRQQEAEADRFATETIARGYLSVDEQQRIAQGVVLGLVFLAIKEHYDAPDPTAAYPRPWHGCSTAWTCFTCRPILRRTHWRSKVCSCSGRRGKRLQRQRGERIRSGAPPDRRSSETAVPRWTCR